ncbi:MAG: Flp family type IVb pilin [Planctomycetota bacterium]|jgi:Flp pilus assembly pilin Flp
MNNLIHTFWNDESGFVVSAELILIATIAVLSLVVGLKEVSTAINNELEDVASAFGAVNQSYHFRGLRAWHKARVPGSSFRDEADFCDSEFSIAGTPPEPEYGSPFRENRRD